MLKHQLSSQFDAMDRRRETRDEQPPFRPRKHLVKLPSNRALARRITLALHVGGILEQRQYALLAVLRERVQIEQSVVGGRRIDLEVPGMNQHAERRMDRQR